MYSKINAKIITNSYMKQSFLQKRNQGLILEKENKRIKFAGNQILFLSNHMKIKYLFSRIKFAIAKQSTDFAWMLTLIATDRSTNKPS